MSSRRLIITMSFHGGRTIADAGVPAIVRRISETCGGSIGVCSGSTPAQALIEHLGAERVRYVHCDVRDIESLQAAVASADATFGPLSVLINNAARDDRHVFADMTAEYWDETLAVNLRHHVFAAQAAAPCMIRAGRGSIINLGSV